MNISIKRNHIQLKILPELFYYTLNIFSKFEAIWSFLGWNRILIWMGKYFSIFLSSWFFDLLSDFSRSRRHSIYWIFYSWKEHVETPSTTEPFFWINLSSIRCKQICETRTQFLIDVTFCSPFALKKVTNFRKWLCSVPHRWHALLN